MTVAVLLRRERPLFQPVLSMVLLQLGCWGALLPTWLTEGQGRRLWLKPHGSEDPQVEGQVTGLPSGLELVSFSFQVPVRYL